MSEEVKKFAAEEAEQDAVVTVTQRSLGGDNAFIIPQSVPAPAFPAEVQQLMQYSSLIEELTTINTISGPMYMYLFLQACEETAAIRAAVAIKYEKCRDLAKKAHAAAQLDKAPALLEKIGRKVSEAACEKVADSDADYLRAREAESYYKALLTYLDSKLSSFEKAHDDAKKIFDKAPSGAGQSSGAPSNDK